MYQPLYKGIIFDGVDLSDSFDINEIRIDPMPETESITIKMPGKRGLRFCGNNIGSRNIYMNMSIKSHRRDSLSIAKAWRRISKHLIKDEPKSLKLDETGEIFALPMSIGELERLGSRGVGEVTFTAYDPYFYGREMVVPLNTGQNKFRVMSDYRTIPTIEIVGATPPFTVSNVLTGEQVRIPEFVASEFPIVVDMAKEKCTRNTGYLAVDMNVTDFFDLPPGEANISISSGNGILKYREVLL